jgi:serine protease AprX
LGADSVALRGVCRDINLIDLRVLSLHLYPQGSQRRDGSIRETDEIREFVREFDVIAALKFVRFLNSRKATRQVHGVNISLQTPHEVTAYGCGATLLCVEVDQAVADGVVVVVASGNDGHRVTRDVHGKEVGAYVGSSISDPGNAEEAITVGSTHRRDPHRYGVSYFSGRGPTGDGRRKPDIVAPGEKIVVLTRTGGRKAEVDGTSFAAPHVSGAAAMLMARYPELIGRPRRIKQILMDSATDLGRERNFQGAGLLDILRAMQSV